MKNKITMMLLLFSLIFTTSCLGGIVKNSIKNTPIANKIYLHQNPRIGDYSILKAKKSLNENPMAGETTVEFKIIGKRQGNFIIRETTKTSMFGAGFMNNVIIEIHADRRGNIKKAFFVDNSTGEKSPMQIAKPGDANYNANKKLSSAQVKEFKIPKKVSVTAGTFSVSARADSTELIPEERFNVNLYNPKVKFQLVSGYLVYLDEATGEITSKRVMELISQGNRR